MTLTEPCPEGTTHRQASRFVPSVLFTAPTDEPVSMTEAKAHCSVDGTAVETVLTGYIQAAREQVEFDAEIRLVTQTRIQYLDYFPDGPIELRDPPVASVSSITYTDQNGDTQTLSTSVYESDIYARPAVIIPAYGQSWPAVRTKLRSIAVTFICGTAINLVSSRAKQAMLLQIGSMYMNREMNKQEMQAYDNLIASLAWRRF